MISNYDAKIQRTKGPHRPINVILRVIGILSSPSIHAEEMYCDLSSL